MDNDFIQFIVNLSRQREFNQITREEFLRRADAVVDELNSSEIYPIVDALLANLNARGYTGDKLVTLLRTSGCDEKLVESIIERQA